MLQFIKENPGVLQRSLYEGFFRNNKHLLSAFFYLADKKGIIRRIKSRGSYELYLSTHITREEFLKEWEKMEGEVSIDNYSYGGSEGVIKYTEREIIKYFGEDMLKKLYHYGYDGTYYSWKNFLFMAFNEGATIKFEMNKSLERVIKKYWSNECDTELRKFLSKYGFFSDKAFVNLKLEEVIGRETLSEFKYELNKKSSSFKIKLCGCYNLYGHPGTYSVRDSIPADWIPILYAESLKYKWKLKPDIRVKKCKYCGKEFIPILPNRIENIVKFYPINNSINEVNFCAMHFPPLEKYDKNSLNRIKKLVDVIGFIPSSNFHTDYNYLKGLDKKVFEKAIILLNDIPGFQSLKDEYSSWLNVLVEAGVLTRNILKTPRGYMCLAEDGHLCRSLGEKNIDDWLYSNGIPHEREVRYPGSKAFRADWKVGEYFIEYWGLKGQEDYDEKMEIKKKLAQKYGISLISITPMELPFLDSKLKKLKDEYGGKELPIYELKSLKRKEEKDEILIELDKHTLKLMKIPGMGYTKIKRLNEAGIHSLDDIRNCSFENLLRIEGFGDELIKRLLAMVGREEECYLFELKKIPMVWNETLIKLSKAGITSIDQLSEYTVEELVRIAGIGIGAARKIKEYIEGINDRRGFKKKG